METCWLTDHKQKFEPLSGEGRVDVAVVGGGITGMTAAYLLSSAGAHVAVLETAEIGSGESGRGDATVSAQHGLCFRRLIQRYGQHRAGVIAHAQEGAVHLVAGIVAAEGIDCGLVPQDSFVYTADPRGVGAVEREAEAAVRLGMAADVTTIAPFLFPYLVAVRLHNQILIHPVKYLDGLAAAIVRKGGRVFEGSPVTSVENGMVRTATGRLRARCVLLAANAPVICHQKHFNLRVSPSTGWVAAVETAPLPTGIWRDGAGGLGFHAAGERLIVCSYEAPGPANQTREQFLGRLQDHFPGCRLSVWPVRSFHTLDGLPYVGRYAKDGSCLFAAAGLGYWGLMGGTLAGHILCDLVLDRPNPMSEMLSPQRLPLPVAIGAGFAENLSRKIHGLGLLSVKPRS